MRRGPLPTTSAPREAGKKHAKRPERSESPVHSPQALTPGSKRTEKLPSTLLHNYLGASLGLAHVPMEIDKSATPPLLMDASFPDDGQQVPELAARARRLFVTPPTAIKPSGVAPPRWGLAIPTWNEVVEYLLGEETVAAAAEDPLTEPLQLLSARALEWRRTALTRLQGGGGLHRFQAEVLAHVLLGRDLFAFAPTGSGKSLAFQLPSLALSGLTVVVSPLRALIETQTAGVQGVLDVLGAGGTARHGLREVSVSADTAALPPTTDICLESWEEAAVAMPVGSFAWAVAHDENLRFAYITPEALECNPALRTALSLRLVSMYVFDEAHTLEDWAHWRTSFDLVHSILDACDARRAACCARASKPHPARPVRLATTATATEEQVVSLGSACGLVNPALVVANPMSFARPNLHLMVLPASDALEKPYLKATGSAARCACAALGALHGVTPDLFEAGACGIVYVSFCKDVQKVVRAINYFWGRQGACGFLGTGGGRRKADTPEAALEVLEVAKQVAVDNAEALRAWNAGEVKWLVATCAFGMGIDSEREVRAVVHGGRFPPTPKDYAQKIGRGGRKGSDTWCLLYLSPSLVLQTAALVALPPGGDNMSAAEAAAAASAAQPALEEVCHLLRVLLLPGCRRRALLAATVGPALAAQCGECTTRDRCAVLCKGSTCCITIGLEILADLDAAARRLISALRRRQFQTLSDAISLSHEWDGVLPRGLEDPFGASGALLLAMLAQGWLYLAPREGNLGGHYNAWRTRRVLLCVGRDAGRGLTMKRVPFSILWPVEGDVMAGGGVLDDRLQWLEELEARSTEARRLEDECRLECLLLAMGAKRGDVVDRLYPPPPRLMTETEEVGEGGGAADCGR